MRLLSFWEIFIIIYILWYMGKECVGFDLDTCVEMWDWPLCVQGLSSF